MKELRTVEKEEMEERRGGGRGVKWRREKVDTMLDEKENLYEQ